MTKLFTIEFDPQSEKIELNLNRTGAEYLKNVLEKLISNNQDNDLHLMSPDWGGELSANQQNVDNGIKLIHHLKIIYWEG